MSRNEAAPHVAQVSTVNLTPSVFAALVREPSQRCRRNAHTIDHASIRSQSHQFKNSITYEDRPACAVTTPSKAAVLSMHALDLTKRCKPMKDSAPTAEGRSPTWRQSFRIAKRRAPRSVVDTLNLITNSGSTAVFGNKNHSRDKPHRAPDVGRCARSNEVQMLIRVPIPERSFKETCRAVLALPSVLATQEAHQPSMEEWINFQIARANLPRMQERSGRWTALDAPDPGFADHPYS